MSGPRELIRNASWRSEVEQATRQLDEKNPHRREEAVRRLQQLKATPRELFDLATGDRNSYVRQAAVKALGNAEGRLADEAIDVLLAAVHDANDHVSAAAIEQLGLFGAEDTIDEISSLLDGDAPVRLKVEAIRALGLLDAREFRDLIGEYLDSPVRRLKMAAVRTLGRFCDKPAAPQVLEVLKEEIEKDHEPDYDLCRVCLKSIQQMEYQNAAPLLIQIAQSQVGLRRMAVKTLIHLDPQTAAPQLIEMLRDPSPELRSSLAVLIGKADYRAALPALRELLDDPVVDVRRAALRALTAWGDFGAAEKVREMARRDPNSFLRPLALRCLVDLVGLEQAQSSLIELQNDTNSRVRSIVAELLEKFESSEHPDMQAAAQPPVGGNGAGSPMEPSLVSRLQDSVLAQARQMKQNLHGWRQHFLHAEGAPTEKFLSRLEAVENELSSLINEIQRDEEQDGAPSHV